MNKGFSLLKKHSRSNPLFAKLTQPLTRFSLPEFHSYGFSLSEVLITLVIIGVISLLVVPNLIDNTGTKLNETAARKANYDVHQAALMLQARCPRHRVCSDGNTVNDNLKALLNDSDIRYKFNGTQIIVDVDGDNGTDLHYTLNADGTVAADANCSINTYGGTGCTTDGLTTFSTATGYQAAE